VQARGKDDHLELQVHDVAGKLYKSLMVDQGSTTRISGLAPGIYMVTVQDKNFRKTERVVVQGKTD